MQCTVTLLSKPIGVFEIGMGASEEDIVNTADDIITAYVLQHSLVDSTEENINKISNGKDIDLKTSFDLDLDYDKTAFTSDFLNINITVATPCVSYVIDGEELKLGKETFTEIDYFKNLQIGMCILKELAVLEVITRENVDKVMRTAVDVSVELDISAEAEERRMITRMVR